MAPSGIHEALQCLGSVDFSSVPTDTEALSEFMQEHFAKAQLLIDSVPNVPPSEATSSTPTARSRSNTASSASEVTPSPARSTPLIPSHADFQKDWGKPLKLGPKDNPLGMGVYKLSAKDGKGAWFARRSVHEGLGFDKWKAALVREFPESLEVKGPPGEGNIRGIGGEERLERKSVEGVGAMEVYHLSAQFPGPTTPRDFVTLLLTSSDALKEEGKKQAAGPRHYIVLSKPCQHPKTEPPASSFIRGRYESVEMIREVPLRPKSSRSEIDLTKLKDNKGHELSLSKSAVLNRVHEKSQSIGSLSTNGDKIISESPEATKAAEEAVTDEARARGKTISFDKSRGGKGEAIDSGNVDEEEPMHAVEWIMLTRSDPGGSVPRFMVERGTPAGICSDAVKFLNWACGKEDFGEDPGHPHEERQHSRDATGMGGYMSTANEGRAKEVDEDQKKPAANGASESFPAYEETAQEQKSGMLSSFTTAAYSGIESYAPQAVIDRLPIHEQQSQPQASASNATGGSGEVPVAHTVTHDPTGDDASSIVSFASAEDYFSSDSNSPSAPSTSSRRASQQDKTLAKLEERKAKLDAKLQKTKEKELKDKEALSEKEAARIRKAEEKHAREVAKAEERHAKEIKSLEERKQRQEKREAEKREKEEKRVKERQDKTDKERMAIEIEALQSERDLLQESVKQLQNENTRLVAMVGKLEGGKGLVQEIKAQGLGRSRSSSGVSNKKGTP